MSARGRSVRRASCAALAALALAGVGSRVAAAQPGTARGGLPPDAGAISTAQVPIPVQMGIVVAPETVTVGDPFRVTVRVRAPRGATIEFPAGPDTAAKVEAIDPRAVRSAPDSAAVDQTAVYRLVAWDVGTLPLGLPEVVVRLGAAERRARLETATVFVRSVLPEDTAKRVPKPARPPMDTPAARWPWWLAALVAAALLGLLLWWLRRRLRRRPPAAEIDAFALAEREFARVESLGLLEAGERGRYVALVVEVLRDYLAARIPGASTSLTSSELLQVVRRVRIVPVDRLAGVLEESDLVKFARRPITAERARELAREARAVVATVERARTSATPAAPVRERAA